MDDVALLAADGLQVRYGSVWALRGVSYRVMPGQIVALLGGNASGKSTSLKSVLGVVRPTAGTIAFQGRSLRGVPTTERVRMGMAVVPEGRRLFARMTVEDNLLVGCREGGRLAQARIGRVYSIFPDVKKMHARKAGHLSGGQQQMVAIGRALMSAPQLLLLDEPCMGLSPALVTRTLELIRTLRESGTTVFLVEQNARAVLSIADYAYVLREGSVWIEGAAQSVMGDARMVEAYLGVGKGG